MENNLRGDNGHSSLIDVDDLPKFDLRFEVLGSLDEASSMLGLVRASQVSLAARNLILETQYDLHLMMSELATVSGLPFTERKITSDHLSRMETEYGKLTAQYPLPEAFIIPGDTIAGALLHLARSVVRRAERHTASLDHKTTLTNPNIIPYLNRLSTLLHALACAEEVIMGNGDPTLARPRDVGIKTGK